MSVATFAAAQILRLLPRARMSRAVGRLCEQPLPPRLSNAVARAYIFAYGVDMSEVAPRGEAYRSFDAFFTRELRRGVRKIDAAKVVSPADGRIVDRGQIDPDSRLIVKGRPYTVADLVGDEAEAKRYRGGSFSVVYLSPRDYHRVHAPVDGRLVQLRGIPGDFFPVNSIGERHVNGLFARNQRIAFFFESPSLGRVSMIMVVALIVGRITVTPLGGLDVLGERRLDPPLDLRRGDEIGVFHLGSTVVLLTQESVVLSRGPGPVRYGQSLEGS